jgi:hypothetical protein
MEELLKGSGVEDLLTGGLSKGVAFVRKSMAKTKQINKGYKPPAKWGYDYKVAKEKDKPSKHIQINIGEEKPEDVVKYKYPRRKKSEEEKRREEVHKFSYWGLTKDDFEEVDGQLVEKKHGLLWGPIWFQPTGARSGFWGLRCCRYDKKGKKIPSNKKYEYIYYREDDPANENAEGVIPNATEVWDKDEGEYVNPMDKTLADPPSEISNTNDEGDEIFLKGWYAKAKASRFGVRLEKRKVRPFFWFEDTPSQPHADGSKNYADDWKTIKPNAKRITYKDIPTIISANRAMERFKKRLTSDKPYMSGAIAEQMDRWSKHLGEINQRVRLKKAHFFPSEGPFNKYRDIASKEDRDRYIKSLTDQIQYLQRQIENTPREKRIEKYTRTVLGSKITVPGRRFHDIWRDKISELYKKIGTSSQGLYTKKEIDYAGKSLRTRYGAKIKYGDNEYTQIGVQSTPSGNNRWGKAHAEYAYDKLDDRQTSISNWVNTIDYTMEKNNALIKLLVKEPMSVSSEDIDEIFEETRIEGLKEYDREDQKGLMEEAQKNLEGMKKSKNNPPDDEE